MPEATWNFYLLKEGEALLYLFGVPNDSVDHAAKRCAAKVLDGSDADAFIMVRSDQDVYDFIHTHFR